MVLCLALGWALYAAWWERASMLWMRFVPIWLQIPHLPQCVIHIQRSTSNQKFNCVRYPHIHIQKLISQNLYSNELLKDGNKAIEPQVFNIISGKDNPINLGKCVHKLFIGSSFYSFIFSWQTSCLTDY